jgi:hypothetical protein
MALLYKQCPSYVAKQEVRGYLGLGKIAASIKC